MTSSQQGRQQESPTVSGTQFQDVGLEQLRQRVHAFAAERDWQQYHTPRNLLLALTGEVGELAEIFQWRGEVAPQLPTFTAAEQQHVGEELSDVLVYLIRMSDVCGIDLGKAVLAKLEKNAAKYPADKCKGSSAKYTAYQQQSQGQQQHQHTQKQEQQLGVQEPGPAAQQRAAIHGRKTAAVAAAASLAASRPPSCSSLKQLLAASALLVLLLSVLMGFWCAVPSATVCRSVTGWR